MSFDLTRTAPVAAGVTMAVIFGLSFSFTKTALESLAPMDLLALRFSLAALAMAVLAAAGVIRLDLSGGRWRRLIPLAVFEPVAYFLCETAGIRATSAAEAGMIIGAIPVVVAVMAAFFLLLLWSGLHIAVQLAGQQAISMPLPMGAVYGVMPLASGLMVWVLAHKYVTAWRKASAGAEQAPEVAAGLAGGHGHAAHGQVGAAALKVQAAVEAAEEAVGQ